MFSVLKEFFAALAVGPPPDLAAAFGGGTDRISTLREAAPTVYASALKSPRPPFRKGGILIFLPVRKIPSFRIGNRAGLRPLSPNRRFRGCMSRRHDICRRCFIDVSSKDLLLDFLYLEHPFHLLSPQDHADSNGARTSRPASVPAASAHIIANSSRSLSAPYFG